MNRVTIEVSSTQPGEAWRVHLASELAALHPGADIRIAYGLVDDAFVWCDEFGLCEERESRTSVVEEFLSESRDSFTAVVLAAEDLGERVEAEVKAIFRVWSRAGRGPIATPIATAREWIKKKVLGS